MPLLPGAAPFSADGDSLGVLLCHGFTGCPQSLHPWAEFLATAGLTVRLPLLPGHGTRWEDLEATRWPDWYAVVERELLLLRERCETVVVMGLSMGGTLALRLAEEQPRAVDGLVLVNPSVLTARASMRLVPLVALLRRTVPGIASDIARPGSVEVGYDQVPLRALQSVRRLWRLVRRDLPRVTAPVLLLSSVTDHVVEPRNSDAVAAEVSAQVTRVPLTRSFHVAPLDHDADAVFARSLEFAQRLHTREASVRDNGLAGEDYVAVAELNPQLADAALVLLRDAGVPAYAEPGQLAPDLAEGPPTASIDRVFVVRASAEAARALLAERLPRMRHEKLDGPETRSPGEGPDAIAAPPPERADEAPATRHPGGEPVDLPQGSPGPDSAAEMPDGVADDVWAGIVASFRAPSADVRDRVLPPAPSLEGPPAAETQHLFPVVDADLADDDEEHFEPEPPPPLPRVSWSDGLAWAAVLLMPLLFLLALWLSIDVTGWLGLFGVAAFVGGFLVLVSRLGDGSEDDWDDGAVL